MTRPLNTTQVIAYDPYLVTRPDGKKDWVQGSTLAFQCSENLKLGRAPVARINVFDPSQFALESLSRYGK